MKGCMSCLPKFSSKAFLAPMAGVSDAALRLLCKEMGAGLVATELTSIHAIIAKERQLRLEGKKITEFVEFSEKERPISIQLFGSDLDALGRAAKIVEPFFDIIDYNMGCPAPHITQQMAGGALLQNNDLTRKIFRTLVSSVKKPITLKMRAGINDSDRFKDVARIAQEEGIQMITLHARTVRQGYSGQSDWSLIRKLKEIVDVPVVGNGDITSPELAKKMIDETGCDYIMIGRAAMGNPFLFKQIDEYFMTGTYQEYSARYQVEMFLKYAEYALHYNIKFPNIRQQAMRFTKGLVGSTRLRARIMVADTIDDIRTVMLEA
ncbi:putative TIM-barrel protein, nifR3 family [Candidatus Nitrosotenuis uzonensis]|uniref:Putative TIM-barrel protein, nifR3 family n=2 Tax=Candidatus Nitrosotenuis uzonensis TaxID=1407055 RepID=A0A812EY28_9ARCH|nr:putative TIM-barrel protein, nifR3 family [Candidatus Nitrosotenuis uzonensis]